MTRVTTNRSAVGPFTCVAIALVLGACGSVGDVVPNPDSTYTVRTHGNWWRTSGREYTVRAKAAELQPNFVAQ